MATIVVAVGVLALATCISQIMGQAFVAYLTSSKWYFRRVAKNSLDVSKEFLDE